MLAFAGDYSFDVCDLGDIRPGNSKFENTPIHHTILLTNFRFRDKLLRIEDTRFTGNTKT